jgi:predicted HTH domain antitoxin
MSPEKFDQLPDVRDGLTRKERIILHCINKIQKERDNRNVPTAMLYGRVVEYVDISIDEMQSILQKLTGNKFS